MVSRTCSRMISDGSRSSHGVSARTPRQVLLMRQKYAGSQVTPDSISTTFSCGNFTNTPSVTRLFSARGKARRLRDVVLQVIGRPAERARRMAEAAAGVNADRQTVLLRRAIDRPVLPPAQRQFGHARASAPARTACPRRSVRSPPPPARRCAPAPRSRRAAADRDPAIRRRASVDRAAQCRGQVLAVHDLRAIQHVADGEPRLECIQRLGRASLGSQRPACRVAGRQSGRPFNGAADG